MNREANTIGSKSSDATIAHLIVRLKEELEKFGTITEHRIEVVR